MTQLPFLTLGEGSLRRITAGALAASLIAPTQALAFFQQTSLEGSVGSDVGGVWLAVHHIMPEFRIQYPKPTTGPAIPVDVGPIPPELHDLFGERPVGVVITKCHDAGFCADNGMLVGDAIIEVNGRPTPDPAAYQEATSNPPQQILISVRRPEMKMTTARLFKIRYGAGQQGAEGATAAEETLDVRILDVALPMDEQIEKSRSGHQLVKPSDAELEALGKGWAELAASKPLKYATGKHRFVAKSSFDESLASDKSLTNSKFAMVLNLTTNPMRGGGSGQVIDVYGIEEMDAKRMTGNYVSVTIANAPFPINIEFKGRFEMKRIADWSDADEKLRAAEAAKKPKEDLNKFETLPDVPPAKPAQ